MSDDRTLPMTEQVPPTPTPWSICNKGECPCLTIWCPDHPIATVESGVWGDEYPAVRQVGASLENKYEAYMERIEYGSIDPDVAKANALLIVEAVNSYASLKAALQGMVDMYVELVESGDAGFWDAEKVPEVIAARAALDPEKANG